jgi:hypothetical protein
MILIFFFLPGGFLMISIMMFITEFILTDDSDETTDN